jgi:hypothetical protein
VLRKLLGLFGIVLMTVGIPFVVMALHDAIVGSPRTERGTLLALVALFGALSFWGFRLAATGFGWHLRLPRRRSGREKEQAVLDLAASAGGRVTLVEVAARCDLTIEEATDILNKLAARGAAEMLVADDGTVVYDFDILSAAEKGRATELR